MFQIAGEPGRFKGLNWPSILDPSMGRITSTIIGIFVIGVVLLIRAQAGRMQAPLGMFNLVTVVMIILIVVSIVRAWLRGY